MGADIDMTDETKELLNDIINLYLKEWKNKLVSGEITAADARALNEFLKQNGVVVKVDANDEGAELLKHLPFPDEDDDSNTLKVNIN